MADGNGATTDDPQPKPAPEAFGRGDLPAKPAPPEAFGRAKRPDKSNQSNDSKEKGEDDKEKKGDDAEKDEAQKVPFYKRPKLMIILCSIALLLIGGGLTWWVMTRDYESTDDAFIDGHIIHVAPRVGGRVLKLNVMDNQWVEPDTVVIEIDPAEFNVRRDEAIAAQKQAVAKEQQAEADLLVAQATAAQSEADVIVAEANAENAEQDLKRFQSLPDQARSRQQLDNASANQKSTAASITAAQKKAAADEARAEAAKTAISAAKAEVQSNDAMLAQRELELGYTKVSAGNAGWVTRRSVEAGNYVTVGQELLAVVPKNVWVTANFKETQLKLMKPGQPAWIELDSNSDHKWKAHVDSIQAGSGTVFSLLPAENATGNYVKIVQRVPVKIVFDEMPNVFLGPGMSVVPKVRIRD